ncbi:hypothetical protein [Bacillus thuringiensis]|uniref:hypothetical protein n=1 Tax=Bacillus thuringiensis TaxID=1428 RepID=UPI000BFA92CF|nr:hypothetical protein [Bacillus thuringiensis]PFB88610.1 hypothetical protein CN283_11930 [Bacillus thuringiensis]PGN40732.1 hypothetical protein CN968_17040 [Bacillus thuringiensis]
MKHILIIGPKSDSTLRSFEDHLKSLNYSHDFINDPSKIRLGIESNTDGTMEVRLKLNNAYVFGKDISIMIRYPYGILPTTKNKEDYFIANEYYATIWTLCAAVPNNIVNRPYKLGWQYEQFFKRIQNETYVPEYFSSASKNLLKLFEESEYKEIHIQDLLSRDQFILTKNDLVKRNNNFNNKNQYRALFSSTSKYIIHLFVGNWRTTLLNEFDFDVKSNQHIDFLNRLHKSITDYGVMFFAVVLTVFEGEVQIVRIETNPPLEWYFNIAVTVNDKLLELLGGE